jgi:hypothetical protein
MLEPTRFFWFICDVLIKHPQYEEETSEAETFLAGSHEFQLDEIEVYEKE